MLDPELLKIRELDHELMQKILQWEFGGIGESMASLASITGDKKYLQAAKCFDHDEVLKPLSAGEDIFTKRHGNTEIPKFIAAAREYELTGDESYRNPAGVMVFRFTADRPGSLTGSISMSDAHKSIPSVDAEGLTIKGSLAGFVYPRSKTGAYGNPARESYDIALDYEARALVRNEGGAVEAKDGKFFFKNVDTLTIYLDAGTDYINQRDKKWRGEHPHRSITERLAKAAATPYSDLLAAHERDYQSLFNRVTLDLGRSSEAQLAMPTDRRLIAYRGGELGPVKARQPADDWNLDDTSFKGERDPGLEDLFSNTAAT